MAAAYPGYYPSNYGQMVEASKNENGVLVYSNIGEMNWRPILDKFSATYP